MDPNIEMHERLARVETKVDTILDRLESLRDLEKRIGALERWRSYVLGAGAFIGATLAWAAHALTK